MAQPYDFTNLTAADNIYETAIATNDLIGGLLALGFLIGAFIILFISFKKFESSRAFAGAAWIVAVLAIFMRLLNFIGNEVMFITFLLAGMSLIWIRFGDGG